MGAEGNGLTLESLAQKLEAQTQRLATLERENAELRGKVATLEGSGTPRGEVPALRGSASRRKTESETTESEALVSRRSLLSKAGAAAVAAMAAGTLLNPREAKANHFGPGIQADYVDAHYLGAGAAIQGHAPGLDGIGVEGIGQNGVLGTSPTGNGWGAVVGRSTGRGGIGTYGECSNGTGVQGIGKNGVVGESPTGAGWGAVVGRSTGPGGIGTYGECESGTGVKGIGKNGVVGESSIGRGWGAVVGRSTGPGGIGTYGECENGTGVRGKGGSVGVEGTASRRGVTGHATQDGWGVVGSSAVGYGGLFAGPKGCLILKPALPGEGPPTSGEHLLGTLYIDSAANLFLCTEEGTPGTWRRVQTVAVT